MSLKKIYAEGLKIKYKLFKKFCEIEQGHPGSILSIFDVVNFLYLGKFVKLTKDNEKNDYLIISKGHAASVQYPYIIRNGIIKEKEWDSWGKKNKKSIFRIFGNNSIPGIDSTSGSLGHGIGIGSGIAIDLKSRKKNNKVYVIVSEGELYEGSTWEALLFASHQKLDNLKIILDVNNLIILGKTQNCLKLDSIEKKIAAFNFKVKSIDGHDYKQIHKGLKFLEPNDKKNKLLIVNTIKGKGISFMENKPQWHYWQKMDQTQKQKLLKELNDKITKR
jgi:transketolase